MNRRKFIGLSLLGFCTLFVVGVLKRGVYKRRLGGKIRPSGTTRLPNILLITADDFGPHMGCYGNEPALTPNLDQLSKDGTLFREAYVTQASCSSSRSSIFTGLYPHQNGQIGLSHHGYSMSDGLSTLPKILKKSNYHTGIIGKIHVAPKAALPFDLSTERKNKNSWFFKVLSKLGLQDRKTNYYVEKMAKVADKFLHEETSKPFFLVMSYSDPHRIGTTFAKQVKDIPKGVLETGDVVPFDFLGLDTPEIREDMAGYYNSVARLDYGVGLLLDALERSGHTENTMVIFIGDHGPPFTRAKTTCYEAGLKIPFLLKWPKLARRGVVNNALVSTVDIFPTVLEAIGAEHDSSLVGNSLLKLLSGKEEAWREHLCAEYTSHNWSGYFPRRCIRNERYKLIVNLLAGKTNPIEEVEGCPAWEASRLPEYQNSDVRRAYDTYHQPPAEELYDLQEDPIEFKNLAGGDEYKAIQDLLRKQLLQWRKLTKDPLLDSDTFAALTNEHEGPRKTGTES